MDAATPSPVCSGCQARDTTIARLEQAVADLQRQLDDVRGQLDQAQRAGKRQAGPFRRRRHVDHPKKPGRPQGHPLAARPLPTKVDRVIDVPCGECPDCHVPLTDTVTHPQYQTDLPPVVPVVTRFDVHGGTCPCCRRYHQGRHPERTSDAVGACANQIGPVALTRAAELKHRLGVPYRKITDFFATYFELRVSPGTLTRAERRLAAKARPTFELLREALRACQVVHADETGWRVGKLSAWLWVFSSATVTIYAIRSSRGHEIPEEILGPDFGGVLVVDGLKTYDALGCRKGRCNGHILRRCRERLEQGQTPADAEHLRGLMDLLRRSLGLSAQYATLERVEYMVRLWDWEDELDGWLERTEQAGADVQRLRRHLARYHEEITRHLFEPGVPATNNHGERMLRPAVISRQTGGCNKTLLGALVHGVLASLMVSVRQQGKRFVDLALRLWRAAEPQGIPLSEWPGGPSGANPAADPAVAGTPPAGHGRPVAFAPSG
jgi:transposase